MLLMMMMRSGMDPSLHSFIFGLTLGQFNKADRVSFTHA